MNVSVSCVYIVAKIEAVPVIPKILHESLVWIFSRSSEIEFDSRAVMSLDKAKWFPFFNISG